MTPPGPGGPRLCQRLMLAPPDLVIVFDDLDLPLGKVRVRMKGSAGGHNGVRSLIQALGTSDLRRVKEGIGRPAPPGEGQDEIPDHLLSSFTPDQVEDIEAAFTEAAHPAPALRNGLPTG